MAIDVYIGAPGEGKTYNATRVVIDLLKRGKQVYTNWPVKTPDGKYCSLMWKKEYATENIQNAWVFIDEAWKDYNSNNWKNITTEEHKFFAECRHVGNNIVVITQSTARIASLIKEIGEIVRIKKKTILLFWTIGFSLYYYDTLDSYNQRFFSKDEKPYYRQEFKFFSKYVANSYDTHINDREGKPRFTGVRWDKNDLVIEGMNAEEIDKIEVSKREQIKNKIRQSINKIDYNVDMVITNCLKGSRKKVFAMLKWLWQNVKLSRPLLRLFPVIVHRVLQMPLIRQLNTWRIS